ncbi:hypothetical protein ABVK25_006324 [Lepraria finkii]|uniref:PH domain-like protein n=1 Tax=Lepraria finkii TaxID=1340010 RepID=A0ABR4B644_9LECA
MMLDVFKRDVDSNVRRHLPTTHSIIRIAPFAVTYLFSPERKGWEKSGVEGSLFIVRTDGRGGEGYAVVVLNRRGLENFILRLEKADQVEVTEEYIILQDGETVHGLWVFEEAEGSTQGIRKEIGQTILECAKRAEFVGQTGGEVVQGQDYGFSNENKGYEQQGPSAGSPDLMALLGQPRNEPTSAVQGVNTNHEQNLLDLFWKAGANLQ